LTDKYHISAHNQWDTTVICSV